MQIFGIKTNAESKKCFWVMVTNLNGVFCWYVFSMYQLKELCQLGLNIITPHMSYKCRLPENIRMD